MAALFSYLLIVYGIYAINGHKAVEVRCSFKLWSKLNGFEVGGFSFFPFIFTSTALSEDFYPVLKNHEEIHMRQTMELTPVVFYLIYVGEYLYHRLRKSHYNAYMAVRFEREAYKYQEDLGYLKKRELWAWLAV